MLNSQQLGGAKFFRCKPLPRSEPCDSAAGPLLAFGIHGACVNHSTLILDRFSSLCIIHVAVTRVSPAIQPDHPFAHLH